MNTTNLFVELIVIGVGAAIWTLSLLVAAFGYSWVFNEVFSSPGGVGLLIGVVYVLGIITDRIADGLFERWVSKHFRRAVYGGDSTRFYEDRRLLLLKASPCAELFEYGRSRMRICRGWTLNSALAVLAVNILIWSRYSLRSDAFTMAFIASSAFLLLGTGACYAWCQLKRTEYIKTRETADFLRKQLPHETDA